VKDDFSDALNEAMELARSKDAAYLPGWSGPHEGSERLGRMGECGK
jgi:hypothetical protein